jgi:hypothetical protein
MTRFLLKIYCDKSMPKSVNKPVKCVVLTTDLETEVTKAF